MLSRNLHLFVKNSKKKCHHGLFCPNTSDKSIVLHYIGLHRNLVGQRYVTGSHLLLSSQFKLVKCFIFCIWLVDVCAQSWTHFLVRTVFLNGLPWCLHMLSATASDSNNCCNGSCIAHSDGLIWTRFTQRQSPTLVLYFLCTRKKCIKTPLPLGPFGPKWEGAGTIKFGVPTWVPSSR